MDTQKISLKQIFGVILLFLFFETVVAVLATILVPDTSIFLACTIMTALALGAWCCVVLILRVSRRPATEPSDGPKPAPARKPVTPADPFTQELKALLAEANIRLARAPQTEVSKAKAVVTKLPLYLVVGAERVGKTSALVNSGLAPTLLAGEAFRNSEVVSTPTCNLWFAGGAIFADVSGRIFLDEPRHWEVLLRLLSGNEWIPWWRRLLTHTDREQTLRGVLLFQDARSFRHASDDRAPAVDVHTLQERLTTLGKVFGVDYPVYVLLSNTDSLSYFPEYFAQLGEAEDQRVLGATLPLDPDARRIREAYADTENKRVTNCFNRLCTSLGSKRMTMLARETLLAKKGLIFEFPREIRRMRAELTAFLVETFRPNPLERGPLLRGFYFYGVRHVDREAILEYVPQESVARYGSDATVLFGSRTSTTASSSASVGLVVRNPRQAVSRWSFLSEFFTQVLLCDHAAPRSKFIDPRIELYRNIGLGLATVFLLVLCLGWVTSWSKNRGIINVATSSLEALSVVPNGSPSLESLEQLDGVRTRLEQLEPMEESGPPLSFRWGLYTGDRVIATLRTTYFARFRKLFLDPMLSVFTVGFSQLQGSTNGASYSDVYSNLKAYRMIFAGGCRPDKMLLDQTLPPMWPWRNSVPPDSIKLADAQVKFYTAELVRSNPYGGQISENAGAVRQAQSYLASFNGPEKLLRGLIERVNREHEAVKLAAYAPDYREVLKGPDRVEWAYAKEGRELILQRIRSRDFLAVGEPCVVGAATSAAAAANWIPGNSSEQAVLEELYVKESIQQWKQFLASQELLPYSDGADAARKLAILADANRSPLLALLFMAGSNTYVQGGAPQVPSVTKELTSRAADRGFRRYFPRLSSRRDAVREIVQPTTPVTRATVADIGGAFQPAWATVDPQHPERFSSPANTPYTTALAEIGDTLRPLGKRFDAVADPTVWDSANRAETKAWSAARALEAAFNRTSEGVDMEVKRLVEAPIEQVHRILPPNPSVAASGGANSAAARLCKDFDQLKKKYPFNQASREEVTLDALNRYFSPGTGEVAQFVQQAPFAAMLQRQGRAWIQNPAVTQPRLSQQFLSALTAQTQFSETLYGENSGQPQIDYSVVLSATAPIAFDLTAGSQTARYTAAAPSAPMKLTWPSTTSGETAKLTVRTGMTLDTARSGLWGIFRLLGDAGEHQGNTFIFNKLDFYGSPQVLRDAGGNPFSLQVQVESRTGVFERGYFQRLGCVAKAVQ